MLGVIRFCDNNGVGIFNSQLFDSCDIKLFHSDKYPHLATLIEVTEYQVRVPQVVWGGKHRCMYKTEFIKQLFTQDQLVSLVSECEANELNVRYGRVRPNTPTYEDEHQVIVPNLSIYRMKNGVDDISGLLSHVVKYRKTAASP